MSLKITYAMNILNGEPFISYQLASIYPFADEIVIVEGAYKKFAHAATEDGHSLDETVKIIKAFDDPEKKIKLIQIDGFFDDRLDMCNEFFKVASGDILWQIDVDEFYLPETHRDVRELFSINDELDRLSFRVEEYFFSTRYVVRGAAYDSGLSDVRRVFRIREGDSWGNQRPPTIVDKDGVETQIREEIFATEMFAKGHVIHHPTVLFEEQFISKYAYYQKMWESITQDKEWIQETWAQMYNPLNIIGIEPFASWLEFSNFEIPKGLRQLERDVENGELGSFAIRDNQDVELYLHSSQRYRDICAGLALNILLDTKNHKKSKMIWCLLKCVLYILMYGKKPNGKYISKGVHVFFQRKSSQIFGDFLSRVILKWIR